MTLQVSSGAPETGRFALFELGFRPFFLLAGLAGLALMTVWLLVLVGGDPVAHYYPPIVWHAHEMLFGYTTAVIIGFLLTAAKNWTGVQTVRYGPLALLAVLWLAGRVLPFLPVGNGWIATVDLMFLPVATAFVMGPIVRVRQYNNLVFLPILLSLLLANLIVHGNLLQMTTISVSAGLDLARWTVVLLLIVMGGRVIPFFIERGIPHGQVAKSWPLLEKLLLPLTLLAALTPYLVDNNRLATLLFAAAAVVHTARLLGWHQWGLWRNPLLWVLYLGYAWLPVGFVLLAAASLGQLPVSTAMHAFLAGAIGTLTVGMMARVILGHTGRPMAASPLLSLLFVGIVCSGVLRVFGGVLLPAQAALMLQLSAGLWVAVFVLFVYKHASYLLTPRVDGKPG